MSDSREKVYGLMDMGKLDMGFRANMAIGSLASHRVNLLPTCAMDLAKQEVGRLSLIDS